MKRLMHYSITLIFGLLFFSVLSADAHLKAEQEVLSALLKYFEARNNEDYKTVVALESRLSLIHISEPTRSRGIS